MKKSALVLACLLPSLAGAAELPVDAFLKTYNSLYMNLQRVANEAAWAASTDASEPHEAGRTAANTALFAFLGDRTIIEQARVFLADKASLHPVVARELGKILLQAAEGPGTIPQITRARVAAESRQSTILDGYTFTLDGKPASANDLDDVLQHSRDLAARQRAWEASKEIGRPLKPGIVTLQKLRNQVARDMKHAGYFALQVADYDMTDAEMMKMLDGFITDTRPMYRKLHAWVRAKLAERYKQPVPKLIPAHWINNRWSQEWGSVAEGAVDLDPLFKDKSPEWVVKTAEKFYTSMGFAPLPKSFWDKSDLYALPADSKRHKNAHATAWHIDLDTDVRSLMSVKPNAQWFFTAHHELGHIYYYISYTRPEVPPILRAGANHAMHEAVGELASVAAKQPAYLEAIGVLPKGFKIDQTQQLVDEALTSSFAFVAWAAGTMAHFEHDLYEKDLPPAEWQKRWWKYVADFQGVAPPTARAADGCDACTKTHINDTPAAYYQYAIAAAIKYQLHDHICKKILHADPHSCSYYGHKEVGDFLRSILRQGATRPFNDIMRDATGEPLSTRAMMEYFKPLDAWLDQELKGKPIGW
ncbi:MAG: Angiotensin-converting enzyme [Myxococcales bacterium]|nr:Angiotensin-converting enzyme [Myxococcales bacterium]